MSENEKTKEGEEPLEDLITFITNLLKQNYVIEIEGVELKAEKMLIEPERRK